MGTLTRRKRRSICDPLRSGWSGRAAVADSLLLLLLLLGVSTLLFDDRGGAAAESSAACIGVQAPEGPHASNNELATWFRADPKCTRHDMTPVGEPGRLLFFSRIGC